MSSRTKVLVLVLVIVVGMGWLVYRVATFSPFYVVEVFDADQLKLKTNEHVKLIGVEVPPAIDKALGKEAQEFVIDLVLKRYVRVETDKQERRPGDNWILGYVYAERDGREVFVNLELIRRGYAKCGRRGPNLKHVDEFKTAEAEAKAAGVGIWREGYEWPYLRESTTGAVDRPVASCEP